MSKFFKQTQRVSSTPSQRGPQSLDATPLNIESLLETINERVDEQPSGLVTSPSELNAVPDVDAARGCQPPACDVVEFTTEPYRQMHIPRSAERILFPERSTTPPSPEIESYWRLRTRLLRLQVNRGFRTVVISSAAKGEGKTLTGINLALCFAQLPEFKVLLFDADFRTRGLSRLLGDPDSPGVAEVLAGDAQPDAAVLATDVPNLYVMGAGQSSMSPPKLFTGAPWKHLIAWAKDQFNLVLVDAPPVLPVADFELIAAGCEGILLVVRARVTTREMLTTLMGQVDSSKLLGIALNSVTDVDHNHLGYYYYYDDRTKK